MEMKTLHGTLDLDSNYITTEAIFLICMPSSKAKFGNRVGWSTKGKEPMTSTRRASFLILPSDKNLLDILSTSYRLYLVDC